MSLKKINIYRDVSSVPTYAIDFPGTTGLGESGGFWAVLLADVDTTLAVPTGANMAIISYESGKDCWLRKESFSLPLIATFAEANAILSPTAIRVDDSLTLHFRCRVAMDISVVFYK